MKGKELKARAEEVYRTLNERYLEDLYDTMKSIFRLEEVRAFDNEGFKDAYTNVVGHYSSISKATETMRQNNKETYEPESIYAYIVKEIAVDGEIGGTHWLSVRSYNAKGELIDECLQDYNLVNSFTGRALEAVSIDTLNKYHQQWKEAKGESNYGY